MPTGGVSETKDPLSTGSQNAYSALQLGPCEREAGTGATLDLQMSAQMHNQILRCWVSPDTAERAGASVEAFTDLPVWKHKSLLLEVNCKSCLITGNTKAW